MSSHLNALKHTHGGNHVVLQNHEQTEYDRMTKSMLADLKPATEPERQIARKIIDLNFRINRITAIENNLLNFDMTVNEPPAVEDEGLARMIGQTRAWKKDAQSFEILGRYEARLSRQLLQYQKELERLQTVQRTQTVALKPRKASFGKTDFLGAFASRRETTAELPAKAPDSQPYPDPPSSFYPASPDPVHP